MIYQNRHVNNNPDLEEENEDMMMGLPAIALPARHSIEVSPFFYNTIFIDGNIVQKTVTEFYKALHLLNVDDPVYLVINSNGGDLSSALAMSVLIRNLRAQTTVITQALGAAMSAGALLLACGTVGCRYATATSTIMAHASQVSTGYGNYRTEIIPVIESIKYLDDNLLKILVEEVSKNEKGTINKRKYAKNMKRFTEIFKSGDKYLSAEEALELGIIDEIDTVVLPSGFIDMEMNTDEER